MRRSGRRNGGQRRPIDGQNRRLVALGLALVLVAGACGDDGGSGVVDLTSADGPRSASGRVTLDGFDETAVSVTTTVGEVFEWCLLWAQTTAQQQRGLMEVTDLGDYPGMVFTFPEERTNGFWMRNTPTPLSIAYLDDAGEVVEALDMEPCDDSDDCPSYPPDGPYLTAVEVPQGELAALGLDGPDARLELTGECEPPG